LLLDGIISVIVASLEMELALDQPRVVTHIVHVEVLVGIVPADNIKEVVIVEDVVGERADFGQTGVPFHQVFLDIESEALLRAHCLVKAAKDQDCLAVDRHAHGQIAGRPGRFGVQVDHTPHVVVDVVHFNCVRDFLLVEFCAATEYIDVLVVENAAGCRVARDVQVSDSAPGVVLDVVFLASSVEALRVVATNHENETALGVKGREVGSFEQERGLVLKLLAVFFEFHHPVAAHVVLVAPTDAEDAALVSHDRAAELRDAEGVVKADLMRDILLNVEKVDRLAAPFEVVHEFVRRVTLLQNKSVVEKLTKLVDHVHILVISDPAGEFAQLTHFKNQVFLDLIELAPDELKGVEVPLLSVLLQIHHLLFELVKLAQDRRHFQQDRLLPLLSVLEIAKCLVLEEPINEEPLNLLELGEQVVELLVVVLLDIVDLFAHGAQLGDLVLHLVLELRYFALEI